MFYYLFFIFIFFTFPSHAEDAEKKELSATTIYKVQRGDTIYDIAEVFNLGFDEILQANPDINNPRHIAVGKEILLPAFHLVPDVKKEGIIINLAESRLYFFASDSVVKSFPISIGADEKTPLGRTKIADKRENPVWIPTASIREENPKLPEIVPPGPDNPLGERALYLDASNNSKWQSIAIHGTNAPRSIGSRVSHGCIRLYPWDILTLFSEVEIGTPVEVISQPVKVDEIEGKIYLESHFSKNPEVVFEKMGVKDLICKRVRDCESRVNWNKVDEVAMQNLGVPIEIGW